MSKSEPDSAIFMEDTVAEVNYDFSMIHLSGT